MYTYYIFYNKIGYLRIFKFKCFVQNTTAPVLYTRHVKDSHSVVQN